MASILPDDLAFLLRALRGAITVADARDAGIYPPRLERLARCGVLTRVGRGAYLSTALLAESDPWTAHALRTRGYLGACGETTFAAGWSGVAVRRLRTLGQPPERPVVVKARSPGTVPAMRHGSHHTRYAVTRTVPLAQRFFGQYAECPVVDKAWLVVDLARTAPRAHALVVADSALGGGATEAGFRRALAAMAGWPGTTAAAWVVDHADGRSESALETLGRYACLEHGVPVPVSNAWVGDGHPKVRVDHLWPWHGVVAEADGALKYNDAKTPAQVVAAEKERQWYLERTLGLDVIRYDWNLAFHDPRNLAERFAKVLAAHPVRTAPVPWWPIQSLFLPPEMSESHRPRG